ncbi:hypothetical protein DLREEDagr8_05640 [Dongia sp. agr-C8]
MKSENGIAGGLILLQFALAAGAAAHTPCDRLRAELQILAAQHPEATEDWGDGRFLNAVIGPKRDDNAKGTDCKSFADWLRQEASLRASRAILKTMIVCSAGVGCSSTITARMAASSRSPARKAARIARRCR